MTAKPPPKITGAKGLSRYSAFVGQTRECVECQETKEISPKTFALHKAGPGGIHATCRSCQGKASIKVRHERESLRPSKRKVKGFQVSPGVDWNAFVLELDGKMKRLTELTRAKVRRQAEIDGLKDDLKSVTRMVGDPAGGGKMTDERLCFRVFLEVLRPYLDGFKELGPIHENILDALLCHDPNVCLLASRNSAKSTLTSEYVCWRLWRRHDEIVLILSRGELLARKMLRAVRSFMEQCPLLHELLPDDDQLNSSHQLEIGPAKGRLGLSTSLTCRGVGGNIPGLRATLLICDDVENHKDDTPEAVDRIEIIIDELQNVGSPGCEIKALGTPQSPWSIYGRLARSESWTVFTARLFEEDALDGKTKTTTLHSRWPARWSSEALEAKRKAMTKRSWALHWALDLSETSDDVQPLRLSDLPVIDFPSLSLAYPTVMRPGGEVLRGLPRGSADQNDEWRAACDVSEDLAQVVQTVAAVDPASGTANRDAIGLSIVSITSSGLAIIRHCSGIRAATMNAAMTRCAAIISQHKANSLLVEEGENGLFGRTLVQLLAARGHPMRHERVATGGVRKGKRIIEAISPALASGRVFACREVLTSEDAVEMVNQFTGVREDSRRLRHDDIVDSLAYALSAVGDVLSASPEDLIASTRTSYERLSRLPRRQCLLRGEELEMYCSLDESMIELRLKRDHVAGVIAQEAAEGKHDANLLAHLNHLDDQLSRVNTGMVRNNLTSLRDYAAREHEYRKDHLLPFEMQEAA